MKLLARLSPLFCLVTLLLSTSQATAGNLPIQVEPAGSTWDTVVADATAQSTGAQSGGTPIYHSTQLEETTLEGDFTADANSVNLAIFSDDGCDVTIDGNKVWSGRDQGQALPNLSQSLSKLPITLNPGQTYHIKIDYSNIFYTGNADVDGCTLFTWNDAPPQVTLTADDPGDPDEFQQVTSKVYAKVDHLPAGHLAADLTATWTWSVVSVTHSDTVDGSYTTDGVTASLFSLTGDNSDLTSPTATFNGEFDLDGFYEIDVQATVKYHDRRTGEDLGPYGPGDVNLGDNGDEPPPGNASATASKTTESLATTSLQSLGTPALHKKIKVLGLRILLAGVDITSTTVTVNAGEPIALTSQYNTKTGTLNISSPSWTVGDNPIGGWLPSDTAHNKPDASYIVPMPSTAATSISYYYTDETNAVSTPVTFSGFVKVGTATKKCTKTVNFVVRKPSHLITTTPSTSEVTAGRNITVKYDYLVLGSHENKSDGMTFTPTGGAGGTLSWQQIVQTYTSTVYFSTTSRKYATNTPGLDGKLTQMGDTAVDSPELDVSYSSPPVSTGATIQESFKTFLMWTSSKASSIPVPLAEVDWNWQGTAGADAGGFYPADPTIVPSTAAGTIKYIGTINGEVTWNQKNGVPYVVSD